MADTPIYVHCYQTSGEIPITVDGSNSGFKKMVRESNGVDHKVHEIIATGGSTSFCSKCTDRKCETPNGVKLAFPIGGSHKKEPPFQAHITTNN